MSRQITTEVAMTQVLSKRQIADRTGCSTRTLERLWEVGEGPARIEISVRRVGVTEADFEAWLKSRRRPAPGTRQSRGHNAPRLLHVRA